jgi:hypothetical protein
MNILNSKSRNISLLLLIGLLSLYFINVIGEVNATVSNDDDDNNNQQDNDKAKNNREMLNLKIKLHTNNIDPNIQKIKIVSYVNGEAKEQYVDLVKDKNKIKNNIMVVNLQFAKSNDISSIITTDQYFVCGYAVNVNNKNQTAISNNEVSLYDCDEGNIGSSDSATAKLFSTLNKFNESVNYNKLTGKGNTGAKEVKIHVNVPLEDAIDDVDQISVVGMVRGEYKVEILNAKDALEKQGDNNNGILDVPFVFNRNTEAGMIQLGDMFFGCVAGEEFSPQHTHCEKRTIKDYEKGNELYSRKDNNFK